MNNASIEIGAISKLTECIAYEKVLEHDIPINNTEPSWDGNILVYKNERHSAIDDGVDRVPVQIKGKNDKESLYKEKINYPVRYGDLRNYYKERGCIYFVIVVTENDRNQYTIYYKHLLPFYIKEILKGAEEKNGKQIFTLKMKRLNDQKIGELTKILKYYINNWKRQIPIIDKNVRIEELKNVDTIEFVGETNNILKSFNEGETIAYVKSEGKDQLILSNTNSKLFEEFTLEDEVLLNEKVYYKKYNVIVSDENTIIIELSPNLKIKFDKTNYNEQNKKVVANYNFSLNSDTKTLENDVNFLSEIVNSNNSIFEFRGNSCYLNINGKEIIDLLIHMKKIFEVLDSLEIVLDKYDLNKNDKGKIYFLYESLKGNKSDFYKSGINPYNLRLGNRDYLIFVYKDNNNKIKIKNMLKNSLLWAYFKGNDEKYYRVPIFSQMKAQDLKNIDEDAYEYIVNTIIDSDVNNYTFPVLNDILLEIIKMYDNNKNPKCIEAAEKIAIFLNEKFGDDITKINYYQIKKRIGLLSDEEKEELFSIDTNNDTMLKCCIDILLDNKYNAQKNFKLMKDEEKEFFKSYPIYNLLKND